MRKHQLERYPTINQDSTGNSNSNHKLRIKLDIALFPLDVLVWVAALICDEPRSQNNLVCKDEL